MRFLVDAQLPPALARYLIAAGHYAEHVSDVGLEKASDREIWSKATNLGSVIVTKDEDFVTLRALQPHGPAIVWVRVGNTTRDALIEVISSVLPAVVAALERGETIVEGHRQMTIVRRSNIGFEPSRALEALPQIGALES